MDHFSRLEIPNFFSISILFILDRENFQLSIYLQNIRFSWWDEVRKLFSKRAKIKNVNIETEDWVMAYWRIVASLCSTSILYVGLSQVFPELRREKPSSSRVTKNLNQIYRQLTLLSLAGSENSNIRLLFAK